MTEQPRRARQPEVLVELRVSRPPSAPAVPEAEDQHLGDRLAAFIDGELDHDARERVQSHLATCAACLCRAEEERGVKSRIAAAAPPDPSALFLSRLISIGSDDEDRQPPSNSGPQNRRGFGGVAFGGGAGSFGNGSFGSGRFGSGALGADHPVPGVDPRAERSRLFQAEPRPIAARFRPVAASVDSRPQDFPEREHSRPQSASRPSPARGRRFAFAAAGAFSVAAVALASAITGVSSAEPTVDEPYGNVTPAADTAGLVGSDVGSNYQGTVTDNANPDSAGRLAFGVPANLPDEDSRFGAGPMLTPSATPAPEPSPTALPSGGAASGLRALR